jgi:hypothetical protein
MYVEPRFTIPQGMQPKAGDRTLVVHPERVAGGVTLRPGFRIRFIYESGRRIIGKKDYTIETVSEPDVNGNISLTFAETYGDDKKEIQAQSTGRLATSIEVQKENIQRVRNERGEEVTVDWKWNSKQVAQALGIDIAAAQELKRQNTIMNFGFESKDEAFQRIANAIPIDQQDVGKLKSATNVTSAELEARHPAAVASRPKDAVAPKVEKSVLDQAAAEAESAEEKVAEENEEADAAEAKKKTRPARKSPKATHPSKLPDFPINKQPQKDPVKTEPLPAQVEHQKPEPVRKPMTPKELATFLEDDEESKQHQGNMDVLMSTYKNLVKLAGRMQQAGYTKDAEEIYSILDKHTQG